MGSLTKTKALFGVTSPRTPEKMIPEIRLLGEKFSGQKWSGNKELQADFFKMLFNSEFYEGDSFPNNPALAARDRITRAPKALGFVDLKPTIQLTEVGKKLVEGKRIDEIFTRQLLKFQLPSPYHTQSKKIEFKVKPYLELLRLLKDLGSLSKTEIAIFFSQLTNIDKYDDVVQKIKDFRDGKKDFPGSYKTYVAECMHKAVLEIFSEEVEAKNLKTRQSNDASLKNFVRTKGRNMKDYADAFTRYLRATGLVTFQKKTFRLIISPQKEDEVNFILSTIDRNPIEFSSLGSFKEYLFSTENVTLFNDDKDLLTTKMSALGVSDVDTSLSIEELKDQLEALQIRIREDNIQSNVAQLKTYEELPDILSVFDQIKRKEVPDASLFLEWNVWRAMVMLNYANSVTGNFVMDIDGMPLNYAPGQKPDIEADYDDFGLILEVTMSSGNTQYRMENESVPRHFGKAKSESGKEMYCIFIAPKISEGCLAHYFNLNRMKTKLYGGKTKIIPMTIEQFTQFIQAGIDHKFNDPDKLKNWLEAQWAINQELDSEDEWYGSIGKNLLGWAGSNCGLPVTSRNP